MPDFGDAVGHLEIIAAIERSAMSGEWVKGVVDGAEPDGVSGGDEARTRDPYAQQGSLLIL